MDNLVVIVVGLIESCRDPVVNRAGNEEKQILPAPIQLTDSLGGPDKTYLALELHVSLYLSRWDEIWRLFTDRLASFSTPSPTHSNWEFVSYWMPFLWTNCYKRLSHLTSSLRFSSCLASPYLISSHLILELHTRHKGYDDIFEIVRHFKVVKLAENKRKSW